MTQVLSRIKVNGKNFEIIVDVDKAIAFKKSGSGDIGNILEIEMIYSDSKKGLKAASKDLMDAFKTEDTYEVAKKIIMQGEVQIPAEYREKEKEGKAKQVIDFLIRNAVDPRTDRPYTADRIERSLDEAGVNISNKPIDAQMKEITDKLRLVLPLKIQVKKLRITVPAIHTGQAYGFLTSYKESEEWMGNGDLKCVCNVPIGFQMEFYDKLNAITHGSAISEEIKD